MVETQHSSLATQLRADGSLRHLLTLDGLPQPLLSRLLERAQHFSTPASAPAARSTGLAGKTVAVMFAEPSTRTRVSFELAAHRLGADVVNIEVQLSSRLKGESILDTVATLESMQVDAFVLRDADASVPDLVARHVGDRVSVLSGGAGGYSHPTQGLLDALTVRQHKGRIEGLRIAIVGDIRHSRVARSAWQAFAAFGAREIRIVAPAALMPDAKEFAGCLRHGSLESGIADCDVVMMLRIQKERMSAAAIPDEAAYFAEWGLTQQRLRSARGDAIVMHPQPMNRGVEIASDVADGPQSVIRDQVRNGVAVRMAVLEETLGGVHS
ncbi:MAG: aspartate carbamoyltransferase catalytic subunit [Gammaproteobacteria bacterium]|jgi:aspartate carbamoyltransferase catalytic subunit|nr:aspartate carbamoyltransferase catalytic subunit [Gammaproteobacteria bacterium]NCW22137.1 aspartate carbamoyltransferase catalytic subunit [Gammaproteobacteria bacterium]NCW56617.1 aspartate carbamoyltransferase catalytic subunit [Gammaproteobacteria bacterium]NDE85963.1 aspartate carbamoyltransferase catalytic subunit [Gammaproteobacteria bacterium]